jgi:hypothetical protein
MPLPTQNPDGPKILEIADKVSEYNAQHSPQEMHVTSLLLNLLTLFVIPLVGFAVSASSLFGTIAARSAITKLEKDWKQMVLGIANPNDVQACKESIYERPLEGVFLPNITGGGATRAKFLGFWAPLSIPAIFCVAWFSLLLGGLVIHYAWKSY